MNERDILIQDVVNRSLTFNLLNFCQQNDINVISDYISDIQGMDLTVLKTMEKYIDERRIITITCEVARNNKAHIYGDLPSNKKVDFEKLLEKNYKLSATGWNVPLKNNTFKKFPDS